GGGVGWGGKGRWGARRVTAGGKRGASSTAGFLFFLARFARGFRPTSWSRRQGKASRTMSAKGPSEKAIFLEAIEISSATEREAYLDSACRDDPQLRAGVEALLRANAEPQQLLDAPGAVLPTVDAAPALERTGAVIGPYKLMEQIREGGLGPAFVADQTQTARAPRAT